MPTVRTDIHVHLSGPLQLVILLGCGQAFSVTSSQSQNEERPGGSHAWTVLPLVRAVSQSRKATSNEKV